MFLFAHEFSYVYDGEKRIQYLYAESALFSYSQLNGAHLGTWYVNQRYNSNVHNFITNWLLYVHI